MDVDRRPAAGATPPSSSAIAGRARHADWGSGSACGRRSAATARRPRPLGRSARARRPARVRGRPHPRALVRHGVPARAAGVPRSRRTATWQQPEDARPPGADAGARDRPLHLPDDSGGHDRRARERLRRDGAAQGPLAVDVVARHALPNALGPAVQVVALNLLYLAGGIVVVEFVFDYPGIGRRSSGRSPPATSRSIQLIVLILAAFYVAVNILADVVALLASPRRRLRAMT